MMGVNNTKKKGEIFEKGIKIVDSGNTEIKVNYLISDKGGQGDVYHVSYKGKDYALKWYCKHPDDVIGGAQYKTISKICGQDKTPGPEFIWPQILVTESNPANGKRFGYLMPLLTDEYHEMEDFLRRDVDSRKVSFNSWNSMLVAGMNISSAMQLLHLSGLSYKDLNPKNFMFNPNNGDVLVVDNDNVSVDGDLCSVKGYPGFMAPEIPRSKYKKNPSTKTDYYSLAVVLYRLFFIDHPMDGKAWGKYPIHNEKVEEYLYTIEPVFHFDPNNNSNRPSEDFAPDVTARWKVMPIEIRNLFIKTFTEGVNDPNKRIPENAWITELSKCRDKLIRLNAQREQFVNFSDKRSVPPRCLGMKVHNNLIALYPQKAIYQISIDGNVHQYASISAGVIYDKKQDKLALRNLTNKVWRHFSPVTKQLTDIGKGQQCPLFPGVMIEFQRENPKIVGEIFDPAKK